MKDLVIFGTGPIAELAAFYFQEDTDRRVAGFTVDAAYRQEETFLGLPLVAFESVESQFPPADFDLFVALAYTGLN